MNYGTKGGGMPSRIFEEPSAKYNETLQMLPIARDTVYNVASKPSLKRIEYGTNSWFCSLQMLHRKFAFQKHRSMSVLKRYMPSKFRGPLSMKSIKFRNSAQYNLGGLPKRRCSLPANLNKSIVMYM